MSHVAKWILLFCSVIMIVDNSLMLLEVETPIPWMILAGLGLTLFFGIGLLLLGMGARSVPGNACHSK